MFETYLTVAGRLISDPVARTVSTGDKDAAKGRQTDQMSLPPGGPVSGALEHQEVAATTDPSAAAATTSGRLTFGPLAEMVQGRTEATTGVVDQKARVAHALTTIDRLSLLGGMIVLGDLRWARRLDPLSTEPYLTQAALSRPPADIAPLERAVAKQPRVAELRFQLGTAYLQAGRKREARRELAEAHRLSPNYAPYVEALRQAG